MYLPPLEKRKYSFQYSVGLEEMPLYVYNDGTYNVYQLSVSEKEIVIHLKIYGKQVVKIRCAAPVKVVSFTPGVTLSEHYYQNDLLHIILESKDIQGKGCEIRLFR
jgi:hypothetical protein